MLNCLDKVSDTGIEQDCFNIKMQLTISILGAGPAGFALAADLERFGISVLVYSHPDHLQHACHVIKNGGLRISGTVKGFASPRVTIDIGEAVEHSRIIILTVPSNGQKTILQQLKKFSLHQHTIIAIPGNLFSLVAESEINVGCILESNISPYSCRMSEGEVTIMGRKSQFCVAALRKGSKTVPTNEIQSIFPMEIKWRHNVMEVCLSNINGVFHPPMMLLNAGRIESTAGDFMFYREGLTRSVANLILAIDQVRLKIGEAFGFHLKSAIEVSNECYGHSFTDLVELAQNSKPHNKLKAPTNLDNRNFSEDVADLLVCWCGLAEKLSIDASSIRAVIVLVEIATGIDYMKIGRNLKSLNLDNVSRKELIERFGMTRCGTN
jgi:opine dehydrogenase